MLLLLYLAAIATIAINGESKPVERRMFRDSHISTDARLQLQPKPARPRAHGAIDVVELPVTDAEPAIVELVVGT